MFWKLTRDVVWCSWILICWYVGMIFGMWSLVFLRVGYGPRLLLGRSCGCDASWVECMWTCRNWMCCSGGSAGLHVCVCGASLAVTQFFSIPSKISMKTHRFSRLVNYSSLFLRRLLINTNLTTWSGSGIMELYLYTFSTNCPSGTTRFQLGVVQIMNVVCYHVEVYVLGW
jgi:hypothetical protein